IINLMNNKANIKTLKVRVKDKHKSLLERMAFEVNQVWNKVNELTSQLSYVPIPGQGTIHQNWSAYELQKLLKGLRVERGLMIHSTTVQEVIAVQAKSRKQFKTDTLRWRISGGPRRSLGWIPLKKGAAQWKDGQVYFAGYFFKAWDSYGLCQYEFRSGSFSQDARGRWYFNIVVE